MYVKLPLFDKKPFRFQTFEISQSKHSIFVTSNNTFGLLMNYELYWSLLEPVDASERCD